MTVPCLILLILISFTIPSASASLKDDLIAYEVLEEYELPRGVLDYKLDNSTGKFSVYLNGTCTFINDSYKMKYKSTISGVLKKRTRYPAYRVSK